MYVRITHFPHKVNHTPAFGDSAKLQKIFHIQDEQRGIDCAMGLIAWDGGYFEDFQNDMRARQSDATVDSVSRPIEMVCPRCGGSIPVDAAGMFTCTYCATLKI